MLIEKPLFAHPSSKAVDRPKTFVGYNLRYLKEMEHLSHELQNETLLSAWIYAGQDLKKWRPNQCSKESYSAYHNQGGGVLRDLSHELDLIRFLFGKPHKVKCIGGKFSNVTVDSEDTYTCLFSTPRCPAIGLQLNYIDHTGQRFMIINTTEHTFTVDLISHTLKKNSSSNPMIFHDDIFSSYIYMHHEILTQKFPKACNMKQALDTVELIKVIEETNEQN
ncbi:MAG: Gfo/Idh/MocA family oxidoreductase [Bdellovibrionota bacterium]